MSKKSSGTRVAAVQAAPVFMNLDATVEKVCSLISEAASNGAKMIGFPESYIPGYPWWIWFGDPLYGAPFFAELYNNTVEIPSITVQKISEAARKNKIYVCVSASEKDGGSLYLSQLWFNPKGDFIGKHRKLKPTNAERYIWGDGDGSMMPCFHTEIGNMGGLQCWEHMVPSNLLAMNSLNEQIHVASWPAFFPGDEDLFATPQQVVASKYYAITLQSFVLMATHVFAQDIYDKICLNDAQKQAFSPLLEFGGGKACVIAPNGKIISNEIEPNREGIAYADIDLNQIPFGKYLIDPAGHYSNPSISVVFNQNSSAPVKKQGSGTQNVITYEDLQTL